jgi:hypothetical protein
MSQQGPMLDSLSIYSGDGGRALSLGVLEEGGTLPSPLSGGPCTSALPFSSGRLLACLLLPSHPEQNPERVEPPDQQLIRE